MTAVPAMLLWTDAYMGDTTHLSTVEHGAYLLILMAMWRNGGSLPNDEIRLARTAKLTLDKWRKIAPTIYGMMTVNGDAITQKRLQQELKHATGRMEKRKTAGSLGGRAKALKYKGTIPSIASGLLEAKQNDCPTNPNPIQNQTSSNEDESRAGAKKGISPNELQRLLVEAAGGNLDRNSLALESTRAITDLMRRDNPIDLFEDILPTIRDVVPKLKTPLRTWGASFLREAIEERYAMRKTLSSAAPPPFDSDKMILLKNNTAKVKAFVLDAIAVYRAGNGWNPLLGTPPGTPECLVPDEWFQKQEDAA
jgi:uncharacterized protein YdaU (DUF1376 family)